MINKIKIPTTWLDSEYRNNLSISAYQIMFHALGYLSEHLYLAIPKSAILNVHEFLVNCYGEKKFGGSYYKTLKNGLEELTERKIVESWYIDDGVLTISFYSIFLAAIYGESNLFRFNRLDELYNKELAKETK